MTARYVLIPKFAELTGYTDKAVRRKMEEGIWIQGVHYRKSPDGHILIDMDGFYQWVEGEKGQASNAGNDQSASGSSGKVNGAERLSPSRRRRPMRNTPPDWFPRSSSDA